MLKSLNDSLLQTRRQLLRRVVPEVVWPKQVTLDGASIPVRGMPFSFGVKRLLWRGDYEGPERALLRTFIQPGMNVVELGGSIGILTAIIAESVGTTGFVISVEASEELSVIAEEWISKEYSHVKHIHGYGFPSLRLPRNIEVYGFENRGNSLGGQVEFSRGQDHGKSQPASKKQLVMDLETLINRFGIQRLDVLVCDIEGCELIATEDSFAIPQSLGYILIELHPGLYPNKGEDQARIISAIQGQGFKIMKKQSSCYLFVRPQQETSGRVVMR